MAKMFITETQARGLLAARTLTGHARKSAKRTIMQQIHKDHPSLGSKKIVLFIENPDHDLYRCVRDKRTKLPLDDGKQVALPAPKAEAPAKVAPAKAVKKAAPAKAVKKAAPAKAVKKAAPAKAVKKAAPAKAVKKAAPAKAVKKAAPAKAVKKAAPAKAVKKAAPAKATAKKTAAKKR